MRSLLRFFNHSTWAASRGYRFLSLLCLEAWCLVPRCSCILVSSTLFRRSLLWALSLFKDWVYFGCLSLSFSFFSSVSIIQFATISMVRVVMDIFINQNASKLFIDFLLCVLLKSGTRGFFVLARVCSYCAGVNIYKLYDTSPWWAMDHRHPRSVRSLRCSCACLSLKPAKCTAKRPPLK